MHPDCSKGILEQWTLMVQDSASLGVSHNISDAGGGLGSTLLPAEVPRMMSAWQQVVTPLSASSELHRGVQALPGQLRACTGHHCLPPVGGRRKWAGSLVRALTFWGSWEGVACFSLAETGMSLLCAPEKASVPLLQSRLTLRGLILLIKPPWEVKTAPGVRRGPVS